MKNSSVLALGLALIFSSLQAKAQINFKGLRPARSLEESENGAAERRTRVIKTFLDLPLAPPPTPPQQLYQRFAQTMIARMIFRQDLEAVSENLMTPSFQGWGVGTDIAILGPICKRVGDYDFVLQSLVHMAYLDEDAGRTLLTEPARRKLRDVLLNQSGVDHHIKFKLKNCPPISITDSENHILTVEIARYLKNQLVLEESIAAGRPNLAFDNSKNGFDEWLLNHLSQFLKADFSEVNSKPYQGYTLVGLANLYSHARSPRVKTAVQMILDYVAAKSAVQSLGMRRNPPFRRQKAHRDDKSLIDDDNTMYFFSADTGAYRYLELEPNNATALEFHGDDYIMFMSVIDGYHVPGLITDLFIDRKTADFTRIRHRDVEVYASSPSFLISGGGRHRSVFGFFSGQSDEWGVPTFVIPANYGMEKLDLFKFDGNANWNKKNNICVAPGFACGENLIVPSTIDASCTVTKGAWTFYDLSKCASAPMGFYVAALRSDATEKKQLAMIEVREPNVSFTQFVSNIVKENADLKLKAGQVVTYKTSDARTISFRPDDDKMNISPIIALNGVPQETDTKRWPLVRGTFINAAGDGLVTIENPDLHQTLILDNRDPMNPIRRIESTK